MRGESMNLTLSDCYDECICHSGVKGMKWGRRLYQNKDGSLTALGKIRYGVNGTRIKTVKAAKAYNSKKINSYDEALRQNGGKDPLKEAKRLEKKNEQEQKKIVSEIKALKKKKDKAMKADTYEKVLKYKDLYSAEELSEVMKKVNILEGVKKIKDESASDKQKARNTKVKNNSDLIKEITRSTGEVASNVGAIIKSGRLAWAEAMAIPSVRKMAESMGLYHKKKALNPADVLANRDKYSYEEIVKAAEISDKLRSMATNVNDYRYAKYKYLNEDVKKRNEREKIATQAKSLADLQKAYKQMGYTPEEIRTMIEPVMREYGLKTR